MAISSLQRFGDRSWTQDKLERVRKYLVAYTTIMRAYKFKFAYIDGFAGTGYHELKQDDEDEHEAHNHVEGRDEVIHHFPG